MSRGLRDPSAADPLERHYTPPLAALGHVGRAGRLVDPSWLVVDPCAGRGVYVDAAKLHGFAACGFDIAPAREDIAALDMFDLDQPWDGCVITNPPFSKSHLVLAHFLQLVPLVSLLLPLSSLEPTKRMRPWLIDHPPSYIDFVGRLKFGTPDDRHKGGAMQSYIEATWLRDPTPTRLTWHTPQGAKRENHKRS